jgi:hypothetical protein
MRRLGMSLRAIGAALGVDEKTQNSSRRPGSVRVAAARVADPRWVGIYTGDVGTELDR